MNLYLASSSPRRLQLLTEAGYAPQVVSQGADETPIPGETPTALVRRLARDKARDAASRLHDAARGCLLAGDTIVVLDDRVLGKPSGPKEARSMLQALSGREHQVMSAMAVLDTADPERIVDHVETTTVRFQHLADAQIDAYIDSGSPFDKAGGYGLQELDARWIAAVEGLHSNVVGLPVERLGDCWERLGVQPAVSSP